jgi:hypothetical protein
MTRFNRMAPALFAAGALFFAAPAMADGFAYPRVVGTGENASVEYGPGPQQNILGGGAVVVREVTGNDVQISHLEARFAQQPRAGLRPVTIGNGENTATAWVPSDINAANIALAQAGGFNGG